MEKVIEGMRLVKVYGEPDCMKVMGKRRAIIIPLTLYLSKALAGLIVHHIH